MQHRVTQSRPFRLAPNRLAVGPRFGPRFGLTFGLTLLLVSRTFAADDPREAVRAEILSVLQRCALPLVSPPAEGKAWIFEATARWGSEEAKILLGWDAAGRQIVRARIPQVGRAALGFTAERSWLHIEDRSLLFSGEPATPLAGSPLAAAHVWPILKGQVGPLLLLARTVALPEKLRLEKLGPGRFRAALGDEAVVEIEAPEPPGAFVLRVERPMAVEVAVARSEAVGSDVLGDLVSIPSGLAATAAVEDSDLRSMLATFVDMLAEKALWARWPALVPRLVPEDLDVDGHPVLVVRGTPEEMGTQYGERLRDAVQSNLRRVLHGLGLFETVRTGDWFPWKLRAAWEAQKGHIPGRHVREMDALADSAGVRREHVYWTNVFPEHFHCSGLALRGAATEGGILLHGRILDYMTEVGLQATAVAVVHVPRDRHAWINVGYAGCIGSVTGMNARGLAMGEMGGRGEGHLDGIPMTFLMREVLERFETTEEALAWIGSVPRTCEYFYVLSDSRTKGMAGVASWARSLAKERDQDDLLIIRPGESHPLLPHGIPDTVLMSAGGRYERLVERVRARYGKIDPESAWGLMGEGVAMTSALHIVLFLPESLELWVSEAGLDARPAYTQPVSRLSLRRLLEPLE